MSISFYTPDFLDKIASFKRDMYAHYKHISEIQTPEVDGTGKKIVRTRPDGKDYIEESYMRDALNKYFPGWSWEMAAPLHFLGAEWIVAQGHLTIIDENLLAFSINPPIRKFYGVDSVRIQYSRGQPHTPENIIDVGDNCKQAATAALKYAINRLTNIGDDIYGKRLEMEGAGTKEQVLETHLVNNPSATSFYNWYNSKHIPTSKILEIAKVKSFLDIKDFEILTKEVKKQLNIE